MGSLKGGGTAAPVFPTPLLSQSHCRDSVGHGVGQRLTQAQGAWCSQGPGDTATRPCAVSWPLGSPFLMPQTRCLFTGPLSHGALPARDLCCGRISPSQMGFRYQGPAPRPFPPVTRVQIQGAVSQPLLPGQCCVLEKQGRTGVGSSLPFHLFDLIKNRKIKGNISTLGRRAVKTLKGPHTTQQFGFKTWFLGQKWVYRKQEVPRDSQTQEILTNWTQGRERDPENTKSGVPSENLSESGPSGVIQVGRERPPAAATGVTPDPFLEDSRSPHPPPLGPSALAGITRFTQTPVTEYELVESTATGGNHVYEQESEGTKANETDLTPWWHQLF